jgi:hypothetical protein
MRADRCMPGVRVGSGACGLPGLWDRARNRFPSRSRDSYVPGVGRKRRCSEVGVPARGRARAARAHGAGARSGAAGSGEAERLGMERAACDRGIATWALTRPITGCLSSQGSSDPLRRGQEWPVRPRIISSVLSTFSLSSFCRYPILVATTRRIALTCHPSHLAIAV